MLISLASYYTPKASGVFDPATLFASGEQGILYDPSDTSTLFQDTAQTVPVTADGDPVRVVLDKSGNANHATAPSDAARPLYRTNGVLHWLQFDGVDNIMETPLANAGAVALQVVASILSNSPSAAIVIEFGEDNSANGHFYLTAPESSDEYGFLANGTANGSVSDLSEILGTFPETAVVSGIADLSAPTKQVRRNGVAGELKTGSSGQFLEHAFYLGGRESFSAPSAPFTGNLYHISVRFSAQIDNSALANTEEYAANLAGITI